MISSVIGTIPTFPVVAPVIAINKSPVCTKNSFDFSILSLDTFAHDSKSIVLFIIFPIFMTLHPSSIHHSLLKAYPDFTFA